MFSSLLLAVAGPVAPPPAPASAQECGSEIDSARWIGPGDYPVGALRNGQRGSVGFTLTVSPAGCPVDCTVTRGSGWPLLDRRTCELMMRRAKFEPRLDAEGRPVAAQWSSVAVWDF